MVISDNIENYKVDGIKGSIGKEIACYRYILHGVSQEQGAMNASCKKALKTPYDIINKL